MLSITGWHTIYRTDLHFIIPVILNQLRRQNLRLFLPIHHAQVNSHGTALKPYVAYSVHFVAQHSVWLTLLHMHAFYNY